MQADDFSVNSFCNGHSYVQGLLLVIFTAFWIKADFRVISKNVCFCYVAGCIFYGEPGGTLATFFLVKEVIV